MNTATMFTSVMLMIFFWFASTGIYRNMKTVKDKDFMFKCTVNLITVICIAGIMIYYFNWGTI